MRKQDKQAADRYLAKLELIRSQGRVNAFETEAEQSAEIEWCKTDVVRCVNRYFPHYAGSPCAAFQIKFANKVLDEPTIKAFAQWGRGLAKSVWCDVIIPFWLWMNDEAHYMVLIGTSEDKAAQLLGDLQAEFEGNPQIIKDFGEQKRMGSWEAGDFKTMGCKKRKLKPFIAKALGMGQPVRGLRIGSQRPDLCVIDDIETKDFIKNPKRQDEYVTWVEADLIPTMDGPIRRLLYANNRFSTRMIQTELQARHPKWHVSHVPAYDKVTFKPAWPEKYHDNYYKELLDEIGLIALEAEYLQEPQLEGKYFKNGHIVWDELPRLDRLKHIVAHWDIAYTDNAKSDYNAVRVWGLDKDNLFWYIQSFVRQAKMRVALEYMCAVQKALSKTVTIHWQYEAQFWNGEVQRTIDEVQAEQGVILNLRQVVTPRTKKYDRILSTYVQYQNRRIRYNKKMKSDPDTQQGMKQLFGIEPGYTTKDDAPDADHQCITELQKYVSVGRTTDEDYRAGRMEPNHERI